MKMFFEYFQEISGEALGGAGKSSRSELDEITIETEAVKLSNLEEDEYDWIVRSTPSAFDSRVNFDEWEEWNEPNLTPQAELSHNAGNEAEEIAPSWHGRPARDLESTPVSPPADFAPDWSAPDLTPEVNPSDLEVREAEEPAPSCHGR